MMKMKALIAFVYPLLLPVMKAQIAHWGPCPEPPVQQNFSLEKYTGKWYEIARLPAQFEKGRCIAANFSINVDGTIKVFYSEILMGEPRSTEGTAVVEDITEPAKLGVSLSYASSYTPYWVLSTDYDHSSMVYSCTNVLNLFHFDLAWILSRTRSLPMETVRRAKYIFTTSNIDVSKMIATQQHGCEKDF